MIDDILKSLYTNNSNKHSVKRQKDEIAKPETLAENKYLKKRKSLKRSGIS